MNLSTITMVHSPVLVRYYIVLLFSHYALPFSQHAFSSLPRTC
jgi:hypothetical protein